MATSSSVWSDRNKAVDGDPTTAALGAVTLGTTSATSSAAITFGFPGRQEPNQSLALYANYSYSNLTFFNGSGPDPAQIQYSQDAGVTWTAFVSLARGTANPPGISTRFEAGVTLTVTNPAMVMVRCLVQTDVSDTSGSDLSFNPLDVWELRIEETI